METTILNTKFEAVGIIDDYKSFIWTDRHDEYGDFEICIPINKTLPSDIKKGYYLWTANSDRLMIVESFNIESDEEEGACFIIAGKSLESILKRRIVWNKTIFSMDDSGVEPNLQNGIKKLITDNIINPSMAVRKIDNFVFVESDDEKITSLTFEAQYLGEEIYDIVSKLCKENEIGFKITYHDVFVKDGVTYKNAFVFKLCAGVDRSFEQTTNPYVIFSPDYDNVKNTNYLDSDSDMKNVVLVVGKSEYDKDGNEVTREQEVLYIEDTPHMGIDRREIFTNATSLSTDDGYGGTMSNERYKAHLRQKGIDTLMDHTTVMAFEGEIDPTNMYVYGEDYFVGDIVQIVNEYGQEGRAYISEYIMSCDESGIYTYPTFKTIQKGVYET